MSLSLTSSAVLAGRILRVGPLRFSAYGVCAAVGLVGALGLSQRSAPLAGLGEDALWDAGIFTATAAFVLSRLLLILRDPGAFLHYPWVVLALPSYTYVGMLLTALATLGYLRWRKLPMLRVMDAAAPCAAVLAAALCLGHFLEGTDAGMPTRMPWGVASPLGRVHPVQLYAMGAAVAVGAVLWRMLQRGSRPGSVAAAGLVEGGIFAILVARFAQPDLEFTRSRLEPGQWIAVLSVLAGFALALWTQPPSPAGREAA